MEPNPFAAPFLYFLRYYTTINGNVYSYSFTADGIRSPLTLEHFVFAPMDPIITGPGVGPLNPDPIPVPITTPPNGPPSTITPEPGVFVLLALGLLAIAARRFLSGARR